MSAIDLNPPSSGAVGAIARAAAIIVLLIVELATLDANYSFRDAVAGAPSAAWRAFNDTIQIGIYAGFYASLAFGLLALGQSRAIAAEWLAASRTHAWGRWLAGHLALFIVLIATLPLFQGGASDAPWFAVCLWLCGGALMVTCAALALAPLSFWRTFAARNTGNLVAAAAAGLLTWAAVEASQNSWHQLSAATLNGAYGLLRLYEPDAYMDAATRVLGAGGFHVTIDAPCSGYEGIGLVLVMLSLYIFAFRRELRFPTVLALLPVGAATIWLLNLLRLSLLVSMGAHVSPDIAMNGFHSQAGWIMFLVVTISFMAIAHAAPIFRKQAAAPAMDAGLKLAIALLAPFAALMAARIGGAIFGDEARWFGAALIAIPAMTIFAYRKSITAQLQRINFEPWLIGLVVGALWIATEPAANGDTLAPWLATQTPLEGGAWLALRILGFALIVPIAEELLFRGYLHRALVKRRFEEAPPAAFTWAAFIVTSLLFGAMHGRWLAGALAGAAFAIALYRSKSLSGPIAAHIAANGLIAAYAVATGAWALL